MNINEILIHFKNTKKLNNNSYQCCCPAHNDNKASLTITDKGDKILMKCHAGCDINNILFRAGLKMSDLYKEQKTINWKSKLEFWKKKEIEAVYEYVDKSGNYLYTKVRFKGKEIIYGILDTTEDKLNVGLKNVKNNSYVKKVLYRLPAVLQSKDNNSTIFFVEGEKDADTLSNLGYIATTCGGVSDWNPEFAKYFKGRSVVILPDNDIAGRGLADRVFEDIKKYAFQIKTVFTSNKEKGDVTDYLITEKHTKYELDALINNSHWINAPYVYKNQVGDLKIHADLLAHFIKDIYKILILTKRSIDKRLLYIYENGVYQEYSKDDFKSNIRSFIPKGKATDNLLNGTLNLFLSFETSYKFEDINTNENIINLKNGIYNIKTRSLETHSSDILSTLQLNCNYFPEKVKSNTPKKWLKFIDDLCTNQDGIVDNSLKMVLQEYGGLILSNQRVYKTKKSLILYSPIGNTGKSVFLNVINSIIGIENTINIPMQKLADRFSLGNVYDKRIITIGDQTSEDITDSSIFKQLTGGDYVPAELKGKQTFNFIFKGGIMIACNNLPYFADDKGNHVFDRMLIIPCTNVIPAQKRNKNLTDEILEERDEIFTWFLEGLHRLLNNNFNFTESKAIDEAIIEYRNNIDTLYHYISSECMVTEDKMDRIKKTVFEENYIQWCEKNGYTPIARKNIKERATRIGIPMIRTSENNFYQFIKYKDFITKQNLNEKENKQVKNIFKH